MKQASSRDTDTLQTDAISLLTNDHAEVNELFEQYKALAEDEGSMTTDKQSLAEEICTMLTVHAAIEEEIFYPAVRDALDDSKLLDEAEVEHQAAKDLIEQIEAMEAGEEMFEAKVTVLQEMIEHHVQEEEKEYFPQVQKSEMDLKSVGEAMKMRKQELTAEMGGGISLTQ